MMYHKFSSWGHYMMMTDWLKLQCWFMRIMLMFLLLLTFVLLHPCCFIVETSADLSVLKVGRVLRWELRLNKLVRFSDKNQHSRSFVLTKTGILRPHRNVILTLIRWFPKCNNRKLWNTLLRCSQGLWPEPDPAINAGDELSDAERCKANMTLRWKRDFLFVRRQKMAQSSRLTSGCLAAWAEPMLPSQLGLFIFSLGGERASWKLLCERHVVMSFIWPAVFAHLALKLSRG